MGSATASKWFIILLIYFISFITLTSSLSNMNDDFTVTGDGLINNTQLATKCDSPRKVYSSTPPDMVELSADYLDDCKYTRGSIIPELCNDIEGCAWENITTWLFGYDTTESCVGDVNTSFYNDDVALGSYTSLCDMSDLQDNQNLCVFMGCTWYVKTPEDLAKDAEGLGALKNSVSSISGLLGQMVTFGIDVGLTGFANVLFFMVFLYIPLIMLILVIVMLVRG